MYEVVADRLIVKDSIDISGAIQDVFNWLWRSERWPRLNPNIERVEIIEETDTFQRFAMDIRSPRGTLTMLSTRWRDGNHSIAYRQERPPSVLREHEGRWDLIEEGSRVRVTLTHSVVPDPERAMEFYRVPTVAQAWDQVSQSLSHNGLQTMQAIKTELEARQDAG